MRPTLSLAAALLAASCADRQVRVSPAASRALGTPEDACLTAGAEVPDFPDGGLPGLAGAPPGPPVEMPPLQHPLPAFEGEALLSPGRPGETTSQILGCLAARHTAAAGARYPAPPEVPDDAVRVNPLLGGLLITHELAHPCCLAATVSATVRDASVRVAEVLSGTPCDCRCASRLRTFVAVAPGRYSVDVVLRGPSLEERTVYAGFMSSAEK